MSLNLLLLSTSVGSLGSGLGGGVELTLRNIALELIRRGHNLKIVAPQGSALGNLPIVEIEGELQITAQTQGRDTPITMPGNSVLANMWQQLNELIRSIALLVALLLRQNIRWQQWAIAWNNGLRILIASNRCT